MVFSGGMDSTICLYWAIAKYGRENIHCLSFDYGQRHVIELEAAKEIADFAKCPQETIDIKGILRSSSPLTSDAELDQKESLNEFSSGVQKTFVPARNILFLTIAANYALSKNCEQIVTGVCEEDFGGYYDCRQDFIDAMQAALNQGIFGQSKPGLKILTPLMYQSKAESLKWLKSNFNDFSGKEASLYKLKDADIYDEAISAMAKSHTCYAGKRPACGKCHACHLRARAFAAAEIPDPIFASI